jgi:hypothetical protein
MNRGFIQNTIAVSSAVDHQFLFTTYSGVCNFYDETIARYMLGLAVFKIQCLKLVQVDRPMLRVGFSPTA